MGFLDLFKRTSPGQTTPLSTAQVDENWEKIEGLFPTPANGNTDVGKALTLNSAKTGFDFNALQGGGAILRSYLKDNTITNAQIGLLAMQKVIPLVQNPESLADFDIKASLCNTVPAIAGTKGVYKVNFYGIKLVKPETKIVRVTFFNNPTNDQRLKIYKDQQNDTLGYLFFVSTGQANPNNNEIEIGTTLHNTVVNIANFFTANPTALTQTGIKIESVHNSAGDGSVYIDFEMLHLQNDDIKYLISSTIAPESTGFNGNLTVDGTGYIISDNYANSVTVVASNVANGDGYFEITQIGDQAVTPDSTFLGSGGGLFLHYGSTYANVTSIERNQNGALLLNNNDANVPQWTYANIFPQWHTVNDTYVVSTQRNLDTNAAQIAQSIFQASNNDTAIWQAQSWDSGNSQMSLITYSALFRNDAGQPNGTLGAFGLRYFTTDAEAIAGLNWAMNNSSGNWFPTMFDITTALFYNNQDNSYEMQITNKTAPTGNGNCYFNNSSINSININTIVLNSSQSGKPERVPFAVLGRIVEVNGNNVLIDASFMFQVVMCSTADGAFGILPFTSDLFNNDNDGGYYPTVYAWRGGKVIDFAGYYYAMQNSGFNGDNIFQYPLFVGGAFRPLQACIPDGTLFVDSKIIPFFN